LAVVAGKKKRMTTQNRQKSNAKKPLALHIFKYPIVLYLFSLVMAIGQVKFACPVHII